MESVVGHRGEGYCIQKSLGGVIVAEAKQSEYAYNTKAGSGRLSLLYASYINDC